MSRIAIPDWCFMVNMKTCISNCYMYMNIVISDLDCSQLCAPFMKVFFTPHVA